MLECAAFNKSCYIANPVTCDFSMRADRDEKNGAAINTTRCVADFFYITFFGFVIIFVFVAYLKVYYRLLIEKNYCWISIPKYHVSSVCVLKNK